MYDLTKKEKLKFILKTIGELGLTPYEIGKKTKLSVSGVEKIVNGTVKNPQENTIDKILLYLENKVLGSNLSTVINKVEEPNPIYESIGIDPKKYIQCIENENQLRREIIKLQALLRKNNIDFVDYFEEEN